MAASPEQAEYAAVEALIALFNRTFERTQTRLVRGNDEPIYLPADDEHDYHRIVFAHGYFSSALHEIAHWCIAGQQRRLQVDYGYWYCPDGRDDNQQAEFEKVEVKPQALEWAFSAAAGRPFGVSTDNLNGVQPDRFAFARRVQAQLAHYLANDFPPRAQQFIAALQSHFNSPALDMSRCIQLSKDLG
ncbi:elongation factor P hydroxylase [Alteromonas facilis]|uniref:elongation factor P hydroxylase n=1 Tax=Alteromonas facilis TaxID=2048004 RepID=UPI000C281305|nr:elongation factor P hydroxylase [Alteromonas facilis]